MVICFQETLSKKPREEQIGDLVRSSYSAQDRLMGRESITGLGKVCHRKDLRLLCGSLRPQRSCPSYWSWTRLRVAGAGVLVLAK